MKITIKIVFPLFLLSFLIISCKSKEDKSIDIYNQAYQLYKQDSLDSASVIIDQAIALDSSNSQNILLKALIQYENAEYNKCIWTSQILESRNYKMDSVNFLIGASILKRYLKDSNNPETRSNWELRRALKRAESALFINPKHYKANLLKCLTLSWLDEYKKELSFLVTCIKQFPDSSELIFTRGQAKYFINDTVGAEIDMNEYLKKLPAKHPDRASALQIKGYMRYDKQNYPEALKYFTETIEIEPENTTALRLRGFIYLEIGDTISACNDFRKVSDLGDIDIYDTITEVCN